MEKDQPDTISDAGLEPGDFLVIQIGDNFTNETVSQDSIRTKTTEYWFFQVADRVNLNYHPLTLRDDSGAKVGPIGPESGVNYQRIFDEGGDDILRINDFSWRLYHFSLGVQQDNLRVYPRIPDNQNGGGFDWLSGGSPNPQNGDKSGYWPSRQIDFDDPPIELESIAWRAGDRSPIQYGFYNTDTSEPVDPILSVRGWGYELRPVYEDDDMLELLADTFKPVYKRDNAVRQLEFSKQALRTYGFDVPAEWKSAENTITVSKSNTPSEIRKQLARSRGEAQDRVKEIRDEIGGDE